MWLHSSINFTFPAKCKLGPDVFTCLFRVLHVSVCVCVYMSALAA